MNRVYVISLTIAIILVICIFLYIISRPGEKFSTNWGELAGELETGIVADTDEFAAVSPAGYTILYGNIIYDIYGNITVNPVPSNYAYSPYIADIGSTNASGNGICGYTLVNVLKYHISNINITITSPSAHIAVLLYNLDKYGNKSQVRKIYNSSATTYNYTPLPTASSTSNIIPPGGFFVIDMRNFVQSSPVSFLINSITMPDVPFGYWT